MKVIVARQVGFCFGVKRAIHMARQVLAERQDVAILGDLIHNRVVSRELEAMGLRKVRDLSGCAGGVMLVRAHGLPADQIEQARQAGVEVVDATCPTVRQAQVAATTLEERGCQVVIAGDANHPEVRGILGCLKNPGAHLVLDSAEEVRAALAERRIGRKVGVVFQTTHSVEHCQAIVGELVENVREVQIINTLCRAVRNRQRDAVRLAGEVDVMLVVGSFKSANSIELTQLLRSHNPRTVQIEGAEQLDLSLFTGEETVGIASGLSTPEDVVDAVRERLTAAFPPPP